jgi:hypothetical protein
LLACLAQHSMTGLEFLRERISRRCRAITITSFYQALLFFLVAVVINLLLLRQILDAAPFQASDLDIGLYGSGHLSVATFSAWNYESGGGPGGYPGWVLAYSDVSLLARNFGLVEKLVYFASLPASCACAYLLLRFIGLRGTWLGSLSLLYQFCPWMTAQFMTGEPVFTWLFALIPLVMMLTLKMVTGKNFLVVSLELGLVIYVTGALSLEDLVVVGFFVLPVALYAIIVGTPHNSAKVIGAFAGCFALGLLGLAYSLTPYLQAAAPLFQTPVGSLFGPFGGAEAQALKLWILGFAGCGALLVLIRSAVGDKKDLVLSECLLLFEVAFSALYFAIPNGASYVLFTRIPLLAPLLDWDKFVLVTWVPTFMILTLSIKNAVTASSVQLSAAANRLREADPQTPSRPRAILRRHASALLKLVPIGLTLTILVGAAVLLQIQPASSGITGVAFLGGYSQFDNEGIPNQYFQLSDFLASNGASFGPTFHTLIVPQNPGRIIPFYVGSTMIPGFLGPSPQLRKVSTAMALNGSESLEIMTILGIKYIAIMPSPGDSEWPGANGPPSVGGWGAPGDGFPQGSVASFQRLIASFDNVTMQLDSPNLTVYSNDMYVGSVYSYSNFSQLVKVANGDFSASVNQTPIGPNLIINGNLSHGDGWKVSGDNTTVLPNGTIEIFPGSLGFSAAQTILLEPSTTYSMHFHLNTTPGYSAFPPGNDQRTYIGIYWNPGTGWAGTPGAFIPNEFAGTAQGWYNYTFSSPPGNTNISATVYVDAEPPESNSPIFTSFTNVTLFPINGTNDFQYLLRPSCVQSSSPTAISLCPDSDPSNGVSHYLTVDTNYSPLWQGVMQGGDTINPIPGPAGLLTFAIPDGDNLQVIHIRSQDQFSVLLFSSLAIPPSLAVVLLIAPVYRTIRRRRHPVSRVT